MVALAAAVLLRMWRGELGVGGELAAWLVVFAIGWLVVFAQNYWVAGNGYHFRYFAPVILAVISLLAMPVVGVVRRTGPRIRGAVALVLLAGSLGLSLALPRPLDDFRTFRAVAAPVAFARAHGIHFAAGDYWAVWSAVFLLERDGDGGFGMDGLRDVANRAAVLAALAAAEHAGGPVQALCIGSEPERCLAQAAKLTRRVWRAEDAHCGAGCTLITLSVER